MSAESDIEHISRLVKSASVSAKEATANLAEMGRALREAKKMTHLFSEAVTDIQPSLNLWAPVKKPRRRDGKPWIITSCISYTKRGARHALLDGIDPKHHSRILEGVSFIRVNVTAAGLRDGKRT